MCMKILLNKLIRGSSDCFLAESRFRFLKGGCGTGASTKNFNAPQRKLQRDMLYNQVVSVIKQQNGMLPYDKYRVLRIVTKKIREGTL